jgi:hypothetical protein
VSGGGTGATPTPTPTPSAYSAGTVTGKGSTIVNGVRFDDSSASITGEDDSPNDDRGNKLIGESVKVGMEVEIEHGVITCVPDASSTVAVPLPDICTATATKIAYGGNSIVAPIANFAAGDATATPATFASFELLGQKVQLSASTTVNLESLVTALADGVVVEVHGVYDSASGITTATRIEVKAATTSSPEAAGLAFRLRGLLTVDVGGNTGTIGSTAVDLSGVAATAATLNGKVVRVKLDASTTPYKVTAIKSSQRKLDDKKGLDAEVEGLIDSDVTTNTDGSRSFTINGAQVSVPASITLTLAKGDRIEVEGHVDSNGVLVAKKVKAHAEDGVGGVGGTGLEMEFHGRLVRPIASGETGCSNGTTTTAFINTYNQANRTFAIWTTTVPYTLRETIQIVKTPQDPDGTKFVGNKGREFSEAALANLCTGGLVVVYGRRSADGTSIIASKVKNDTSTE